MFYAANREVTMVIVIFNTKNTSYGYWYRNFIIIEPLKWTGQIQ